MKKILTSLILICSLLCMPLMFNVRAETTDELENVIGLPLIELKQHLEKLFPKL